MVSLDDILDLFFEMLKDCIESITLPTGTNLLPTFFFSLGIFVVTVVMKLFHIYAFIDWRGALVATVLLGILVLIERRGEIEVSRLYRAVAAGASNLKERAKRSGSGQQNAGGLNPGDELPEEAESGAD